MQEPVTPVERPSPPRPGSQGAPPLPGAPGYPRPGTDAGGASYAGHEAIPGGRALLAELAAGASPVVTPGGSVVAQVADPTWRNPLGPQANSSARLQQGGGTMPQ